MNGDFSKFLICVFVLDIVLNFYSSTNSSPYEERKDADRKSYNIPVQSQDMLAILVQYCSG